MVPTRATHTIKAAFNNIGADKSKSWNTFSFSTILAISQSIHGYLQFTLALSEGVHPTFAKISNGELIISATQARS